MNHIAIIGTEGSGKTILATVWARRLAHSLNDQVFLSYEDTDTQRYVENAWRNLNKGQWLPSTPQGTRTELEWKLQLGNSSYPVKLIDLPGQDLRRFFDGGHNTLDRDTRELFEYVSSASIVFAVINLERILNEPEFEDHIILSAIVKFLERNAEAQHLYFVFTAWDKVAAKIQDEYGSLTEYIKRELTPFYRVCQIAWKAGKGIYFLTVAPVAQTEYDVSNNMFIPKKKFRSYNLDNFTAVLIQSLASLQDKTKRPKWDEAIVHPPDDELETEWRNRVRVMKQKNRMDKFLKFLGVKEQGQETIEKITTNLNEVTDGIGVWNTFTERYAQFTGRARRREYWNFSIITTLLMLALFGLCGSSLAIIPLIYCVAIASPSIAVSVRRMHDIGRSGWWVLISLIPWVGVIIFLVMASRDGQPHGNEYGPNPKDKLVENS